MQISLPQPGQRDQEATPLARSAKSVHEFLTKFKRDWMMMSAAGLAYNLMVAVVPFGIAILAVLGLTLGRLNPQAQTQLVTQIQKAFPSAISSQNILQPAITRLNQSAGWLTVLAVITALFGGSRLFIAIARCFDIVYRTHPRKLIPQYAMALSMMLVFIVLTPIMVVASSLPAVMLSLLQNSALSGLPGIAQIAHNRLVLNLASLLGSLLVAWILFQAIYMTVPNESIRFKRSWLGALLAGVLLVLFMVLFPFYVTHFMSSYTGVAGFAVIFLLFFYYFALILLFGAQVNAYFSEGVQPLPAPLPTVLRDSVEEQPRAEQLAPPTMGAEQASAQRQPLQARLPAQPTSTSISRATETSKRSLNTLFGLLHKDRPYQPTHRAKRKRSKGSVVPAIAGTALAFMATLLQLRKKAAHT